MANYYYMENGLQLGPFAHEEFDWLVKSGKIEPQTMVWHEGLKDWQPYSAFQTQPPLPTGPVVACSQCGRDFTQSDTIRFQDQWVCADCKPLFFQRIKEGQGVVVGLLYAGFWPRFGAKIIDGLILWIADMILMIPLYISAFSGAMSRTRAPLFPSLTFLLIYPVIFGISFGYNTYFVGKYGATL